MSHFTILQTAITDADTLVGALADMGFSNVEFHDQPVPLVGYMGDTREQAAEIVIRREQLSSASNDIGFRRQPDGRFEALISDYDRPRYGADWIGALTQRYAYRLARRTLASEDYSLVEETVDADNTIRLTVRRVA